MCAVVAHTFRLDPVMVAAEPDEVRFWFRVAAHQRIVELGSKDRE